MPTISSEVFVGITIVSKGDRPANVQSFSFLGDGADLSMVLPEFNNPSASLPKIMPYGDSAIFILTSGFQDNLADYVKEHMSGDAKKLYLYVSSTTKQNKIPLSTNLVEYIQRKNS